MNATMPQYETLFRRHTANPILSGKDWPYLMNSVFNAGATLLPDGKVLVAGGANGRFAQLETSNGSEIGWLAPS